MVNLPLDIKKFGFVHREKSNGIAVKYKCGRDFLYYALNYYFPEQFNANTNNPQEIDRKGMFGISVPTSFAWTQLQFIKVPRLLKELSLDLVINNRKIDRFLGFASAMIFSRISYEDAIRMIEKNVKEGKVSGVDIALRFGGLEDHVLFVYGYDENNLYVFDTNKIPKLDYEKITNDEKFIMKISRNEVKKRWKTFSRVWEVKKLN